MGDSPTNTLSQRQLIEAIRATLVGKGLPDLSDEQWEKIEDEICAEWGGERVRIHKRGKHPTNEQRARIFREAIDTNASDQDLMRRYGISRSTLYRYMKRG